MKYYDPKSWLSFAAGDEVSSPRNGEYVVRLDQPGALYCVDVDGEAMLIGYGHQFDVAVPSGCTLMAGVSGVVMKNHGVVVVRDETKPAFTNVEKRPFSAAEAAVTVALRSFNKRVKEERRVLEQERRALEAAREEAADSEAADSEAVVEDDPVAEEVQADAE